ncbi:MAG: hypothetical protein LBQ61_09195 [Spirochaetales bacterium]|jgi:hypothetical protein|nr:hypothetical protein [Spirochaetales bacterium]
MMTLNKILLFLFALPAAAQVSEGQLVALRPAPLFRSPSPVSGEGIPECYETRERVRDWLSAPVGDFRSADPGYFRQNTDGATVRVVVQTSPEAVYGVFLIQEDFSFPLVRPGNYVIKRDSRDGSFVQIKIFLQSHEGSFIRIFPLQNRVHMDVYLLGRPLYQDLVLPLSFEGALTAPLSQIMELCRGRVDWEIFAPPPPGRRGESLSPVIRAIRERLPGLGDSEDGAMSAEGRYVFIETLEEQPPGQEGFNCSGFAKWIVDGFIWPATGRLLGIQELKQKPLEVRGSPYSRYSEESRDPFFGLDWTRALAVSLARFRRPGTALSPEARDVRRVPFFEYVEDVGYRLEDLPVILYLLSRENPGRFYLGSVNLPFGSAPVLRQHIHTAVFFPYFTPEGKFETAVMERNVETSLESLASRYPGAHVHLSYAEGEGDFILP